MSQMTLISGVERRSVWTDEQKWALVAAACKRRKLLIHRFFYKPLQATIKDQVAPADNGRLQRSIGNELEKLRLSDTGQAQGIRYPDL